MSSKYRLVLLRDEQRRREIEHAELVERQVLEATEEVGIDTTEADHDRASGDFRKSRR